MRVSAKSERRDTIGRASNALDRVPLDDDIIARRKALDECGLTTRVMGGVVGISHDAVARWERHVRHPPVEAAEAYRRTVERWEVSG